MQPLIVRAEYQLSVEQAKNRLFYQNFAAMEFAPTLPTYLPDWTAALAQVRPGFCILADIQVVNKTNPALLTTFQAAEQLIVGRGVRLVAEVHVPGVSVLREADEVTTRQAMPVRHFLSVWEALQFLDEPAP